MPDPRDFDSYPRIQYWTKINPSLFEVLTTLHNKIDRELKAELNARCAGTRVWLLTNISVAEKTWKVIEALAFFREQLSLKPDIAVAIPPLARVFADSLIATVFIFEDLATRLPWFWKSLWREICEEYDRLAADHSGQAEWADYLRGMAIERDKWRDELPREGAMLSAAELADPSKVNYWPNPGRMRKLIVDANRRAILDYVVPRHYGALSGAAHLSGRGLMSQSIWLAASEDVAKKYFSDQVINGLMLLLSLLSQLTLDVVRDPALARRIATLWESLNLAGSAVEMYERCFKSNIEALAAR